MGPFRSVALGGRTQLERIRTPKLDLERLCTGTCTLCKANHQASRSLPNCPGSLCCWQARHATGSVLHLSEVSSRGEGRRVKIIFSHLVTPQRLLGDIACYASGVLTSIRQQHGLETVALPCETGDLDWAHSRLMERALGVVDLRVSSVHASVPVAPDPRKKPVDVSLPSQLARLVGASAFSYHVEQALFTR